MKNNLLNLLKTTVLAICFVIAANQTLKAQEVKLIPNFTTIPAAGDSFIVAVFVDIVQHLPYIVLASHLRFHLQFANRIKFLND